MDPRAIVEAFVEIWHELPSLFRSAWKDVFPRLEEILLDLQASTTRASRNKLVHGLAMEIHPFPVVRDRLREILDHRRRERSESQSPGVPGWQDLVEGINSCLEPPQVLRHIEIQVPRRLRLSQVEILEVAVLANPREPVKSGKAVHVQARQSVEVHLQGTPGMIEVLPPVAGTTFIEPCNDSPPIQFKVRGLHPGTASLRLDFRQSGSFLRSFEVLVEIHEGISYDEAGRVAVDADIKTGGRFRVAADLDLRIFVWKEKNRMALRYDLYSAAGVTELFHTSIEGPIFERSESNVQKEMLGSLDQLLPHEEGAQGGGGRGGLDKLGHNLYDQLFPPEMRAQYLRFRATVETLQIISDEPWIPWELIKPYDGTEAHDFLGAQFICARWLSQSAGPAGTIGVSRLACIAVADHAGRKHLSYPPCDRETLKNLASKAGIEDVSPNSVTFTKIESLMSQGKIDLWHFATHGEFCREQPAASRLFLEDGIDFSVGDLDPSLRARIAEQCPFVFFNVAQGAQQGWGLTRLDGWAWTWVVGARCGAFVAPLFAVRDSLAHLFAASLYEGLQEGLSIGRAMARAQSRVRKEAPGDPAWLAYCLYANPNAKINWLSSPRKPTATAE